MSRNVVERLRSFTARLLERRGAEVDWPAEADAGLALLPSSVADALRCLEILPLSADADAPLPINLISDFLERVEPLVQVEPAVVCLRIGEAYLKRSDMSEAVARAFTWRNARVRVQAAEPARVEYHAWYFMTTLDSADRWQQITRATINAATGAEVHLPELADAGVEVATGATLSGEPGTLLAAARAALRRAQVDSGAFVERLEARLARDRQRLQDYYRALLEGDEKRGGRRASADDASEREARARVVQLELKRKLGELDERYACRVELFPLVLARIDCPALAVRCHVLRRSAARLMSIYWNPLSRELEPLCCSHCGVSTYALGFSDDKVAPLCAACRP
ncbi:MAG: hypothetical protein IPM13_05220 [Phycisphaerales bacterium]|nr:hypothetical protein [Phycisphaerales bacterium]